MRRGCRVGAKHLRQSVFISLEGDCLIRLHLLFDITVVVDNEKFYFTTEPFLLKIRACLFLVLPNFITRISIVFVVSFRFLSSFLYFSFLSSLIISYFYSYHASYPYVFIHDEKRVLFLFLRPPQITPAGSFLRSPIFYCQFLFLLFLCKVSSLSLNSCNSYFSPTFLDS